MDISFILPAGEVSCDMTAHVVKKGWLKCRTREEGKEEWTPDMDSPERDIYVILLCAYPPCKAYLHMYNSEANVKPFSVAQVQLDSLVKKGDTMTVPTETGEVMLLESDKWYRELISHASGGNVDPQIIDLLSSMSLENKSYEGVLASNGFDKFEYLLKAELTDLVEIGVPVGHARVLVEAIKSAPVVIPDPAYDPSSPATGTGESESQSLIKSFVKYDPIMQHDTALKATIYSAKLLECEAQLQKLRQTRKSTDLLGAMGSFGSTGHVLDITGSWKEDKKSSECCDRLLIELSVPAAARKVLKGLDVTYHIQRKEQVLTIDEVSRFGSNKSVIELDNIRREVRSGDNTAFVTGYMDAEGCIHKVTELPNGLGVSHEVWGLTSGKTAMCETRLTRKSIKVASQKRCFNRLEM
eukprot:TRINITY_DN15012_c0_g2_i1.p1 TRINITY_DN15012_c0_g2~~TRINITY_DN15012_c0_g2_i1.p1  ORF type:complete len:412 (+),score=83.18 TRINITY_DN15012_c0_g2_i1:548-1783(+)